ncbi:PAS domain S-box-containing protein [Allosediminivita pacifica]|uniref:histidine kinase n=2 Tax=Allosediminivita pacifica TaxID=1267769 RepID=A0A2T6B804_9RHOB|nr:PAS domain S-box-containing protein [Allosediminivita pacifica]
MLRLEESAEAAKRQLNRFRQMADNAPGAVYERVDTVDGQWVYTYHSAGMPDLFGVTAEEIQRDGRAVFKHIDADQKREIAAQISVVRQTGEEIERVLHIAHPTRGMRAVMLTTRPYTQPDGSTIWFGNMADITAQVAAERRAAETAEQLRASHDRLNRLADNAPGALWEYREMPDGTVAFAYFSASLPEMVGVDAETLHRDPTSCLRYVSESDSQQLIEKFEIARETHTPFSCSYTLNHPQQGARRLLISAQPSEIGDGVTAWFANLLDVTKQEETEARAAMAFEELKDLHKRLSSLAGNAPAALYEFRIDENGKSEFPFFTPRMPALMGVSAKEITENGQSVFDAVHPEDLPAIIADTERSRETLEQFSQTFRTTMTEGGERWITATAKPIVENGSVARWFGFMFDATERMEAEKRANQASEELRRAHARFLVMADNAPGAIFEFRLTIDRKLHFLFVSPQLPALLGVTCENIQEDGFAVYTNVPREDREASIAHIHRAINSGKSVRFRHRVNHPERGERWVLVSLSPNKYDDDGVNGFGNAIDVTEDVRRETELRRTHEMAEKMRRENEHQALHDGLTGLPNRRSYDRESEVTDRLIPSPDPTTSSSTGAVRRGG